MQEKVKNFLQRFFSNRTNLFISAGFLLLFLLIWISSADQLWFGVFVLIFLVGIALDAVYKFPLKKSVPLQIGVIIFFIVVSFAAALIRDVYFQQESYNEEYISENEMPENYYKRTSNPNKEEKRNLEGDYDCSDFASWEEAQKFFEDEGGPQNDWHNLDRNGDGIACESLI